MKKMISMVLLLSLLFVGCSMEDIVEQNGVPALKLKRVEITAEMLSDESRAALDSQTGAFTWQSGDLISVLATDGKFYDFVLEGKSDVKVATFVGQIPETAVITTVATYPRLAANGADNTIYADGVLNYTLPAEWTYAENVSNVPMVATFAEGSDKMGFKQVGGVIRFPVKNLPAEAKFAVTVNGRGVVGTFPVDVATLGESYMAATEGASSTVTINYSANADGADAEFNVPVPVGVYNDFTVTVTDGAGERLFVKEYKREDYTSDIDVKRASLVIMKDVVLAERPMVISEVWPFFVDARVVFGSYEGVSQYALYIDGAQTPVIATAEELRNNRCGVLIGGNFSHNTTHTVAVAKVVDGNVVEESKSEIVEFTTAKVFPLTVNTGTKFVTVGWDDVAIGYGPKYVDGKWTLVPKTAVPDDDLGLKLHQRRGYRVQLLAEDKTTVVYELVPFCGHDAFTGAFSDSSWLGKVDNNNIMIPTALAFGYLEPGKSYYFRVKTLDEAVVFDSTNGNYLAPDDTSQPYPYLLISERGGCGWSELVELSTDAPTQLSDSLVFHEGFDDLMVANDYMNWASAVVPDLETTKRQSWDDYVGTDMATGFAQFLQTNTSERRWTTQAFSKTVRVSYLGLYDDEYKANTEMKLNSKAGSLEGWTVNGEKESRTAYPIFGAIRIGQSGSNQSVASISTPAIESNKLYGDIGTKAKVTIKVAYCATSVKLEELPSYVDVIHKRGENLVRSETFDLSKLYPEQWAEYHANSPEGSTSDYAHYQQYYDIVFETYLRNKDSFTIAKSSPGGKGFIVIGDVKIEIVPGEYEGGAVNPEDTGIGTEPDDTNYDVFGLGEFPITYWYSPISAAYRVDGVYSYELTKARYQEIKDAGFNVATYGAAGENDYSIEENVRLLRICEELGLKFFGNLGDLHQNSESNDIPLIKEHLSTSNNFLGVLLRDEPPCSEYDALGSYVNKFMAEMPNKEVYINLFPMYASVTQLGTSYEDYIDQYLENVKTKSLSYDFYPLLSNDIHHKFYANLDLVRAKTLRKRIPFWAITQAGRVVSCPAPNYNEQRWSVWSNIALGSKGISYFCYWTPPLTGGEWDYYIIDRNGEKTHMYDWVKQINADINTIGKKLLPCHTDGAILSRISFHYLWTNGSTGRTKYGPIQKVESGISNYQVLCGCFRDARKSENGENYKGYKALVMSQIPNRTVQGLLTLDPAVTKVTLTHNNTSMEVDLFSGLSTTVGTITVSYTGNQLALTIPDGEAVLVEF